MPSASMGEHFISCGDGIHDVPRFAGTTNCCYQMIRSDEDKNTMTHLKTKRSEQTGIFNRKLLEYAKFPEWRDPLEIPPDIGVILQALSPDDRLKLLDYFEIIRAKPMEFPVIESADEIPNRIVPYSKTLEKGYNDFDCWVCFCENDAKFEIIRNRPFTCIRHLLKFRGILSPDFTLQTGTARATQILNTYCGRVIGSYLQFLGQRVILFVRYAGNVSGEFFCDSIPKHSVVALGALGCMRNPDKRRIFFEGLELLVKKRKPRRLIIYGTTDKKSFQKYIRLGIEVFLYPSRTRQEKDKLGIAKPLNHENERQGRLF